MNSLMEDGDRDPVPSSPESSSVNPHKSKVPQMNSVKEDGDRDPAPNTADSRYDDGFNENSFPRMDERPTMPELYSLERSGGRRPVKIIQPLGQRSNHCRSRKSVRGHISMYNLHPVYIPYFLQVLSLLYFTSTTPNKDQQKEHLFCSLFVLVL